jgi:demethylmenaquinone methyltransferase / 2-methoxy-6-polyprenyl-1,4-benzoquinol methylase
MSGVAEGISPTPGALDRAEEVRAMFDQIAPKYDRANRILSLGLDQSWRRGAIRLLQEKGQGDVLDLCAGTLDLSEMLLASGAKSIVAVDFSEQMLQVGQAKLKATDPVKCVVADARELPLEDNSVDAILCAFGLRNVPEVEKAIAECARVLRPGGRLVVLDFFQPTTWFSRFLQGTYNRFVVPLVGGLVTGFKEAYSYLAGSIDAFMTRQEFQALLESNGLAASGKELFPPVASRILGIKAEEAEND